MKIKVKIGDFEGNVRLNCRKGYAEYCGERIELPESFYASSKSPEKINYGVRLFHLHSMERAESMMKALPSDISKELKIIPVGKRLRGAGIERYWIVREALANESEAMQMKNDLFSIVERPLRRQKEIEGGIYKIFPENPSAEINIATDDGTVIARNSKISLSAPDGITISDAPIGETFHWEHKENLLFMGDLILQDGEKGILAVNEIDMEDYLASVNSSEMSSKAPLEFLKAQTIAARGTVLATMGCHHHGEPFDLCNGDHCQCYYGSGRVEQRSERAAKSTDGQILIWNGIIADTRYAKTCGGITEKFYHVWEDYDPAYLTNFFDGKEKSIDFSDWNEYIDEKPDCYCNPDKYPYPDYFDYAKPWFRWEISYTNRKLSELIRQRTGRDLGTITEIIPLKRGDSGRIKSILIKSEGEIEINGELNIRRAFSDSHLPSSCFVVNFDGSKIIIKGAGWGHGVGMCQMGALTMANLGFKSEDILLHYYPEANLVNIRDILREE